MSKKCLVAWVWVTTLWFLPLLACNIPWQRQTIPPPPTSIPSQGNPTNTPFDTTPASTLPVLTPDTVVLPTFTPVGTPVLVPTLAGTLLAPTVTLPGTSPTTTTASGSQGLLSFTYTIAWALSEANPYLSVATVTITAQGGNGQYTYYHDDILQPGATFTYDWASCRANPGSLRVDSGDGQSVRVDYYENPPCPQTPTP